MNRGVDYKKFIELMWLFANDACVKVSTEQIKVKFEGLEQYSIDQISKASDELLHRRIEKWPAIPSIPEFVKAIENQTPQIDSKTKAQLQHDIVMKYFNYYGRDCNHVFKDPITKYLMTDRWSFLKISSMNQDELKWFKINFVNDYTDLYIQKDVKIIEEKIQNAIPANNLKQLLHKERI